MFGFVQTTSLVAILASLTSVMALPAATSDVAASCTTTKVIFNALNLSPTETVYASTATEVVGMQCKGCQLTSIFLGGPGPVVKGGRTATITAPVTTSTVYACNDDAAFTIL